MNERLQQVIRAALEKRADEAIEVALRDMADEYELSDAVKSVIDDHRSEIESSIESLAQDMVESRFQDGFDIDAAVDGAIDDDSADDALSEAVERMVSRGTKIDLHSILEEAATAHVERNIDEVSKAARDMADEVVRERWAAAQ